MNKGQGGDYIMGLREDAPFAVGFWVFTITTISLFGLLMVLLDYVGLGKPSALGELLFLLLSLPILWIAMKIGFCASSATASILEKLKNFIRKG